MTCEGRCEQHRALRPADGSGRYSAWDRKDARCVRYLSSGRDLGAHVVAQTQVKAPEHRRQKKDAMDLSNASNNRRQALLYH